VSGAQSVIGLLKYDGKQLVRLINCRQVFEVAYVIVKAGISPRPGNWILERSLDGKTFFPWQYYAISDQECETWFGVSAIPGRPTYRADSEVICTSYYSKLDPFEGGEVSNFQNLRLIFFL
jgi:laminin, alpha 1/2